ncbi:LLM class flavin-dependent oxidoreductase [Microbispora sp. NPDC088329]|uniref:LLM class flavin-dependent oxidoreductase n=1 Tax=Microbispora sp. NPDC088329 TaxID=3154869 RepID=UPI00341D612F
MSRTVVVVGGGYGGSAVAKALDPEADVVLIDPRDAALGFILGGTRRIAGFANVTNLPTRPAPMLARMVTSSSALSGGGPPVTYRGKHYQVNRIEPAPVPAPPVWTGSVGRKSLAATGRVADGWIPGHAADWLSERYRTSRPIIDEAAAAAGRDPREIRTVFNLPGRITDRPLPATRDSDGRWIGGSAGQWVEELTGAVLEHGATGFTLFSADHGAPDPTLLARRAQEVVPAVREATAKR